MQTKLPNRQVQKPDGMQDASITNLQFHTDAGTRPDPGPQGGCNHNKSNIYQVWA